jgi:hypothetical protein
MKEHMDNLQNGPQTVSLPMTFQILEQSYIDQAVRLFGQQQFLVDLG